MITVLKDLRGRAIKVKVGTSLKVTGTFYNYLGVVIDKDSLLTLTLTVRDGKSGGVVNSRNGVNIKDVNGGYVSEETGELSLYLNGTDNTPVDANNETEERICLITFTWNDGVDSNNQTSAGEFKYVIDRTTDAR